MVFVCMVRIPFDSGWFLFVHDSHIYNEPAEPFRTNRLVPVVKFMFSTPDTWCEVVAQFSLCYSKRISRNQECGSISTPSDMLAIAAMAFQHQGRFGLNFVANCTAHAPASDW